MTDWDTAAGCERDRYARYFWGMIDRGVYLPCSQYEAFFVSTAHTAEDIDATIARRRPGVGELMGELANRMPRAALRRCQALSGEPAEAADPGSESFGVQRNPAGLNAHGRKQHQVAAHRAAGAKHDGPRSDLRQTSIPD